MSSDLARPRGEAAVPFLGGDSFSPAVSRNDRRSCLYWNAASSERLVLDVVSGQPQIIPMFQTMPRPALYDREAEIGNIGRETMQSNAPLGLNVFLYSIQIS